MHIDGACHCGYITFEAEVDPAAVRICHCTDCQTLTGSAYRVTAPARTETFRLLTGEPTIYVKTADSGNKRAHAFCPRCGTPIYAAAVTNPQTYGIRVGTTRQRAMLRPRIQIWCRSALEWAMNLEALPKSDTQAAVILWGESPDDGRFPVCRAALFARLSASSSASYRPQPSQEQRCADKDRDVVGDGGGGAWLGSGRTIEPTVICLSGTKAAFDDVGLAKLLKSTPLIVVACCRSAPKVIRAVALPVSPPRAQIDPTRANGTVLIGT